MCGILGAISFQSSCPFSLDTFQQAMNIMAYRGPDAQNVWRNTSNNLYLGHLRLSIIDLHESGTQPMHYTRENGYTLSMVFNGEVYNYREIRTELEKLGYQFKTQTDSEVVLLSYAAWGYKCVDKFNGMFAIAIYDEEVNQLFIVRDRMGIKPIYYCYDEKQNSFIFGSEVKAIKPLITHQEGIDLHLIHQYMQLGYIPGEKTLNQGINRVLPGHFILLDLTTGKLQNSPYWALNYNKPNKNKLSFDEAIKQGKALLDDSLDLQLRSDVPLGVFLSGGLDSSAVVGLLAQKTDKPIETFSVNYDFGQAFDESHYAQQVSKQFKTNHHQISVSPDEFASFIPKFVQLMDEPVTESAAISLHYVAELAKKDVTVVLSGEGSDEIFGGYQLYPRMQKIEQYHQLLGKNLTSSAAWFGDRLLPTGNKIKKYLNMAAQPFEERYRGISVYDNSYMSKLYRPCFLNEVNQQQQTDIDHFYADIFKTSRHNSLLDRMLAFDTKTWLVDDLLIKADRMSMASSLELRVPFLDHRFVEFAASLPTEYKLNKNEGKYFLKKMMEPILPKNIIYREKMGFPTPLKLMLQNHLHEYTYALLCVNPLIAQFFNLSYIKQLCHEHFTNKMDHHRILWQLIVLEEWMKNNQA